MVKKILFLVLLILSCFNVFAISVVENTQDNATTSSGIANVVAGAVVLGIGGGLLVGLIVFIVYWIVKKIKDSIRKHSDLLYGKFLIEIEKCHQNRDARLKYRNWKTFFLTFRRSQILLNTIENGLKVFGLYDGELIEKDNFFLVSVYRKTGLFTREKDIIIIPYELRTLCRKELHGKNYELIINAESIDEALNTDYYAQLVIKDHKDNDKLINFNEFIQINYMEKYILRQAIRDNLLDYKTTMDKIVELNPNIQVERKNPKN